MATSLANAPALEWVGSSDGTPPVVMQYAEATSETFKKGDLVSYDLSENGIAIIAQGDGGVYGDSDNNEVSAVGEMLVLGVALQDASGTAGTLIDVLLPRASDFFAAAICATDNTTLTAPVIDDIGSSVDFIKFDSNNGSKTGVLRGTAGVGAKVVNFCRQDTLFRGGTPGSEPTYSAGDRVIVRFQETVLSESGQQA